MRDAWTTVQGRIDAKRFNDVSDFLQIQHYEARWWRDACLPYFASVSKQTDPERLRRARARPRLLQDPRDEMPRRRHQAPLP